MVDLFTILFAAYVNTSLTHGLKTIQPRLPVYCVHHLHLFAYPHRSKWEHHRFSSFREVQFCSVMAEHLLPIFDSIILRWFSHPMVDIYDAENWSSLYRSSMQLLPTPAKQNAYKVNEHSVGTSTMWTRDEKAILPRNTKQNNAKESRFSNCLVLTTSPFWSSNLEGIFFFFFSGICVLAVAKEFPCNKKE